MSLILVLPILIPLFTASLCMLAWRRTRVQHALCVAGALALLGATALLLEAVWRNGIQATQAGNWPAPFGVTLVADLLSATMVLLAALVGVAVVLYSGATIDGRRVAFGYYPIMQILVMGVCGAFLTGDIFNLYVWFEVMLMASFVLLALGGERAQLEGAIKYVTLNLVASTLFLTAAGLLYALTGTLNMADLAVKLQGAPHQGLISTLSMLFLVSFGIKAGVFPLFFWLPASYHTPPFAVSALFAGLLTKVGVYTLIRVFTLIFVGDVGYTHTIILVIAGLTMITGVLGALAQSEVRRVLSFLIISGIGFAVMGLGLFTAGGLSAAVVYLIHTIMVTTALFLLAGVIRHLGSSEELAKLGGLYAARPGVALLFLICALSLAGIPPFSGFIAKLALLKAALGGGQYGIAAVSLVASVLTLLAVTRIWSETFWKEAPQMGGEGGEEQATSRSGSLRPAMVLPIAALAMLSVAMGLGAAPVVALSERAAQQLVDRSQYVRAVLGEDAASNVVRGSVAPGSAGGAP